MICEISARSALNTNFDTLSPSPENPVDRDWEYRAITARLGTVSKVPHLAFCVLVGW